MLFVCRDDEDRITGCAEVWTVDDHGQWDPQGRSVRVEQIDTSSGVDFWAVAREVMWQGLYHFPQAVQAFWVRRDKDGGHHIHCYTRARIEQMVNKHVVTLKEVVSYGRV